MIYSSFLRVVIERNKFITHLESTVIEWRPIPFPGKKYGMLHAIKNLVKVGRRVVSEKFYSSIKLINLERLNTKEFTYK